MDRLTGLFRALSDGNRMRVVAGLMREAELCACQVVELLGVSGATASRHMGILVSAGLVASRKEGRWVYYRLRREEGGVAELLGLVEGELEGDAAAMADAAVLARIMACEPEDLCRKQRGEGCCPLESVEVAEAL